MVDDALGFLSVVEFFSFHDSFCQSSEFLVGECADLPIDVAILGDEEECRDGLNACSHGQLQVLVHIHLQYFDTALIVLCKPFQQWCHALAGTTPCGIEIDNDGNLAV